MPGKDSETVTLVGPTHPYTGGIAQHTTRLALELEARGYHVVVESWKKQYPRRLYPGPVAVPGDEPEIGIPSRVLERLTWYNPLTWWAAGRRARSSRILALSIPTPFHAVPYLVMRAALGNKSITVGIVHNVLPHEPGPLDRRLMRWLLTRLDRIVVHGEPSAVAAQSLGVEAEKIVNSALPSPWPSAEIPRRPERRAQDLPLRLLFFGTIRPYKGLDVLLSAIAQTQKTELTIAGQFWDDEESYREMVSSLGLDSRVFIQSGYVANADFAEIFGSSDLMVLPYRSGTGSIVRELGFRYGLPVIATDVGAIAEGIEDDVNGKIIPPNDIPALVEALTQAQDPQVLGRWSNAVRAMASRQAQLWENYVQALLNPDTVDATGRL